MKTFSERFEKCAEIRLWITKPQPSKYSVCSAKSVVIKKQQWINISYMFYSTVINILHVTQHTCNKQCTTVHSKFKTKCKIHLNKYKPTLDVVEARWW